MRRKKIGTMDFHGSVDITDPCYNKDVWCRMNDVKIKEGIYTCMVWYQKDKGEYNGKPYCYETVGINGIYLHLSVAELVFLMDRGICPKDDLLYQENRQAWVETIYTRESIYDNTLENLMEYAVRRDEIIDALQRLIKLKRVVLL